MDVIVSFCRCMTADLELKHKNVTKARSIIEKARLRNPQNPELWRKAVVIEWEHGSKDQVFILFNLTKNEIRNVLA